MFLAGLRSPVFAKQSRDRRYEGGVPNDSPSRSHGLPLARSQPQLFDMCNALRSPSSTFSAGLRSPVFTIYILFVPRSKVRRRCLNSSLWRPQSSLEKITTSTFGCVQRSAKRAVNVPRGPTPSCLRHILFVPRLNVRRWRPQHSSYVHS